jgi:peptidoglycan/LPS O-acetylase OafA/YrhL
MHYRREIDGLRAVAVAPVILFHAGVPGFEGGYVGVDVFFVISGYLITSIILREIQNGEFSIVRFYERRIRRIIPALMFVTFACIPAAYFLLMPAALRDFGQSVVGVALFSSNLLFWQESGYFGEVAEFKPLLHTWSLAVEEQFYVFFPLFLLICHRVWPRGLLPMTALLSVASLALAELLGKSDPAANFYLLPSRMWELGIGALAAIFLSEQRDRFLPQSCNSLLTLAGICMIGVSVFSFDERTAIPGLAGLVPTAGAVLVILFAGKGGPVARVLSWSPLVGLGLISYSAYLWHQPLLAFERHRTMSAELEPIGMAVAIAATIALAYATWRWVEAPFRDRSRFDQRSIFAMSATATGILILVGMYAHFTDGRVFDTGHRAQLQWIDEQLRENYGLAKTCNGASSVSQVCESGPAPKVVLWGDSIAMHLAQALQATPDGSPAQAHFAQITKTSCTPLLDVARERVTAKEPPAADCIANNDRLLRYLDATPSVSHVVISTTFAGITHDSPLVSRDGQTIFEPGAGRRAFLATLETLERRGLKIIVVSPAPQDGENKGRCLARATVRGRALDECHIRTEVARERMTEVSRFLAELPESVKVINLMDHLCDPHYCAVSQGESFIYRDPIHFSAAGSRLVGTRIGLMDRVLGHDSSSSSNH